MIENMLAQLLEKEPFTSSCLACLESLFGFRHSELQSEAMS